MLKKMIAATCLLAMLFGSNDVQAQRRSSGRSSSGGGAGYKNAAGIMIDFGDGTLFGFSGKRFFSDRVAGQGLIMFSSGTSINLGADVQYHVPIASAPGLQWYAGGGILISFYKSYFGYGGGTGFGLRPQAGLDYKLESAPINFSFDWRPIIGLNQGGGFNAARFGLAARYTF
jgi:hypothetical protein